MQKAWNSGRHFNKLKFKVLLLKQILQNVINCKHIFPSIFSLKCSELTENC